MRDRESCYRTGNDKMYQEREKERGGDILFGREKKEKSQSTSSFI
jgi:hypothetical protein